MDFISEFLGQVIWGIIAVPVVWIIATPYILIASFFKKGRYWKNVREYYKRIKDHFWKGVKH